MQSLLRLAQQISIMTFLTTTFKTGNAVYAVKFAGMLKAKMTLLFQEGIVPGDHDIAPIHALALYS
jgi:hypothetical protein